MDIETTKSYEKLDLLTPTTIIDKNLALLEPEKSEYKLVVLLTTGSMCPIHKGHVRIVEQAKDYLEKNFAIKVLGG